MNTITFIIISSLTEKLLFLLDQAENRFSEIQKEWRQYDKAAYYI